MAKKDLEIEIIVRDKTKVIANIKEQSNNDILKLGVQGMQLLETRIGDIGYKITQQIKLGNR